MMLTTPVASQKQAFPLAGTLNRLSLSELHTKHRDSPSLPVRRKLWIKLNCAETEKLANSLILAQSCRAGSGVIRLLEIEESTFAIGGSWANSLILWRNAQSVCREIKDEQSSPSVKPGNYSGSPRHYRYLGSVVIRNGCNNENQQVITCSQLSPLVGVKLNQQITDKEKGSTENATLWGYGFFHHELNQHLAARQDLQLVKNYLQNPHMLNDNANLRNYKNQHLAEQYARTYEILVGHRVTVSKPVQPFGSMPRRSNSFRPSVFIQFPKLIPAAAAAASNCAFSSGVKRTLNIGERPAPLGLLSLNTVDMYRPIDLVLDSLGLYLNTVRLIKTTPPKGITSTRRGLTTNDRLDIEAAMLNHTPTRFKFLFLAVHRSDLNAKPHRESVTAHSEQDARRSLAGQFVLFFAGRLPEVSHA